MKALVLEVRDGVSAVLAEDGTIQKVNKVYSVGETIELKAPIISIHKRRKEKTARRSRLAKKLAAAAAALALVAAAGGGITYQTAFACTYVSVDVNPSMEFALNRMDRVISVRALNEDAEDIVDILMNDSVRFKTLNEALNKTARVLKDKNYLKDDTDVMLVDIASESDNRARRLSQEVRDGIDQTDVWEGTELYLVTSTMEERDEAREHDMSASRYSAMKESLKVGEQDTETSRQVQMDTQIQTDTQFGEQSQMALELQTDTQSQEQETQVQTETQEDELVQTDVKSTEVIGASETAPGSSETVTDTQTAAQTVDNSSQTPDSEKNSSQTDKTKTTVSAEAAVQGTDDESDHSAGSRSIDSVIQLTNEPVKPLEPAVQEEVSRTETEEEASELTEKPKQSTESDAKTTQEVTEGIVEDYKHKSVREIVESIPEAEMIWQEMPDQDIPQTETDGKSLEDDLQQAAPALQTGVLRAKYIRQRYLS